MRKQLCLFNKTDGNIRVRAQYNISTGSVFLYSRYLNIEADYKAKKRYRHTVRGKYHAYKGRASFKGQEFNLSFEDFKRLVALNCCYCGEKVTGLDRIDSNKGYTLDNVAPCCKYCNIMKNDLTLEQFYDRISKIYRRI